MYRYTQCPSTGTDTTLRIASFTQRLQLDGWSVIITPTDGSGGPASTLAFPACDLDLRTVWQDPDTAFAHQVTLEVKVLRLPQPRPRSPDLHTIRARLQAVAESRKALHSVKSGQRIERLVDEMEGPNELGRNNEVWADWCLEHEIRDFLV